MIPAGWKLVTEVATPEMVDAGRDGYSEGVANLRGIRSAYAAMLEAAPSPPSEVAEQADDYLDALDTFWKQCVHKPDIYTLYMQFQGFVNRVLPLLPPPEDRADG